MIEKSKIKNQKSKIQCKSQNFTFWLLAFGFWFCLLPSCYAQPVSSKELINNARQYDGKTVVYQGETIGDIMVRGEYAWINVNDGENAIGIWVNKKTAGDIRYTGTYKTKGDLVEISGIFNRSCKEHGGDLDIHASSLQIIKEGFSINEQLSCGKARLAIGCGIILFLALVLKFYKDRRRRT